MLIVDEFKKCWEYENVGIECLSMIIKLFYLRKGEKMDDYILN
jgi:hypothetical protein